MAAFHRASTDQGHRHRGRFGTALSRRTLIRAGAGSCVTALAGCSTLLQGASPAASFDDWLYEPGAVGDTDHYPALRYTPGVIADSVRKRLPRWSSRCVASIR